ncbi:hypothetical protein DPEC_G00312820 [Dallia pectoralis]|uniref:Uncharacterized protein n=1 Tax=Dallia pectoralis TaxID=75939 RepID=A0ACC2FBS8_DALPE|nr:hypothetical protein DPEC_G00312820 [Dallia pectoralis]
MIRTLFIIPVPLFWITGVSLSKEVHQSPSEMLLKHVSSDEVRFQLAVDVQLRVNMDKPVMIISVHFLCLTGFSLSVEVHQIPSTVISRPGENIQLFCQHQKTDYRVMLCFWRRLTMIRTLFIIPVTLFWITGVSLSKEVHQSPSEMLLKPGDSDRLNCSHKIPNYDTILWYQRSTFRSSSLYHFYSIPLLLNNIMMIRGVVNLFVLWVLSPGSVTSGNGISQRPPAVVEREAVDMRLSCSHNMSNAFFMLWYKRPERSRALTLVGHLYSEISNIDPDFTASSRFNLEGNSGTLGELLISNLTREDSGEYLCAVSLAQCFRPPAFLYRNPSP